MIFSLQNSPTQPRAGFTLVEMMVSLAIFAVVTGFTIANFRAGSQSDDLRIGQQLAASAVRRAQTAALGGELVSYCAGGAYDNKICPTAGCGAGQCQRGVPQGFGVRFMKAAPDNQKTIFFADINGNRAYDGGEEIRSDTLSSSRKIGLSAIVLAPSNGAPDSVDIVFVPPKPVTYFNAANTDATVTLTLRHTVTGSTKVISVNRVTGQVNQ